MGVARPIEPKVARTVHVREIDECKPAFRHTLPPAGPEMSRTSDLRFRKPLVYLGQFSEHSVERDNLELDTKRGLIKHLLLADASKPHLGAKVQSIRESGPLENGFRQRAVFEGAELGLRML
jgi:hypothetical protein